MKVFISWSGDLSRRIAVAFRDWLPSVIQAIQPYVSSEDIDKGARWVSDIAKELEQSSFGILCVTQENLDAPWLNFEAGALSKSIDKSRVCPFLFGLKRSDITTGPLLQFQSTLFERGDVSKLLHSLNMVGESPCLDEARLESIFEVWWPKLQEALTHLAGEPLAKVGSEKGSAAPKKQRSEREILEEILDLARNSQKVLNSPQSLLPPDYVEFLFRRAGIRESGRDVPLAVYDDLLTAWRRLRDISRGCAESESVPSLQVLELCRALEEPMAHVILQRPDRCRPSRPPTKP